MVNLFTERIHLVCKTRINFKLQSNAYEKNDKRIIFEREKKSAHINNSQLFQSSQRNRRRKSYDSLVIFLLLKINPGKQKRGTILLTKSTFHVMDLLN